MKLVIAKTNGDLINLENVENNETIENVKALIEVKTSIPIVRQSLKYEGRELQNSNRLNEFNLSDGSILSLEENQSQSQSQSQQPGGYVPGNAFGMGNQQQPGTGNSGVDINQLMGVLSQLQQQQQNQGGQQPQQPQQQIPLDPLDPQYQEKLYERIQQQQVQENMEKAIEYTPEAFGRVIMLYVDCKVNNTDLKAFVDSGAQMTIMSKPCAEKCGIMRLLDKRFSGVAQGVGTANILGRVHLVSMQIGGSHFPLSITVIENQNMEFLIGLDMLRRHQCSIDLKQNVFHIGEEKAPFLSEAELPVHLRNHGSTPPSSPLPAGSSSSSSQNNQQEQQQQQQQGPQFLGSNPSNQNSGNDNIDESKIKQITELGFSREQAIQVLKQSGGNVDLAASILFGA